MSGTGAVGLVRRNERSAMEHDMMRRNAWHHPTVSRLVRAEEQAVDREHFDTLTRRFAVQHSRRGLVAALVGPSCRSMAPRRHRPKCETASMGRPNGCQRTRSRSFLKPGVRGDDVLGVRMTSCTVGTAPARVRAIGPTSIPRASAAWRYRARRRAQTAAPTLKETPVANASIDHRKAGQRDHSGDVVVMA
jgi:hypothetical protein